MSETVKMKPRIWKTGPVAPDDAARPRCKVLISYDGIKGVPDEDETDLIDWLITIAYQTQEEQ